MAPLVPTLTSTGPISTSPLRRIRLTLPVPSGVHTASPAPSGTTDDAVPDGRSTAHPPTAAFLLARFTVFFAVARLAVFSLRTDAIA